MLHGTHHDIRAFRLAHANQSTDDRLFLGQFTDLRVSLPHHGQAGQMEQVRFVCSGVDENGSPKRIPAQPLAHKLPEPLKTGSPGCIQMHASRSSGRRTDR